MGHFHIQQKRNKKNHKIMQGHSNKNSIQNAKHNTKHSETTSTDKQIHQKWHLPNEMLTLPTKISMANRQNIPHQIQRTYTSNQK
jgi:hypothetical protein